MMITLEMRVDAHKRPRFGGGRVYQPRQVEFISALRKYKLDNKLKPFTCKRLSIIVIAMYSDNRRIDCDNILKNIFDSLMDAGYYKDDNCIFHANITKMMGCSRNAVHILLEPLLI